MPAATPDPVFWLAQTKLRAPPLRSDLVPRPRLLDALRDALRWSRLILISAPAGYGKTTLLAALRDAADVPMAWLSLDEDDNDPACFLAGLIASLQRLRPTCGAVAQTLLAATPSIAGPIDPGTQPRRILGVLINEILETIKEPFAVVLDDLHVVVQPSIHLALGYLLERLPDQMHLVVATRQDPPLGLARLRANGLLAEWRLPDLRFTVEEAAAFLTDRLRLELSADDLGTLHQQTGGWGAGLRLLAGSLERLHSTAARTAFIAELVRTDRHVFDYLADEVLARQEPTVRRFLLETSILKELQPEQCRAVTGRADAAAILEDLNRRSLFVTAADEAGTTLRYHALFADFLQRWLEQEMPHEVAELHRRAAEAEHVPARAIGYYLAGELWEPAARSIEQVGDDMLLRGLLGTLIGWIDALPAVVRESHPRLVHLLGVCAWQKGQFETARPLLERALRDAETTGDERARGQVLADLATCLLLQGDLEHGEALIGDALALPVLPATRVQLLMERAVSAFICDDWEQAETDFAAALAVAEASGDENVLGMLVLHIAPAFATLPGGADRMESVTRRPPQRLGDQPGPLAAAVEAHLAFVHFWRGRLEEAIQAGERALAIGGRLGGLALFDGSVAALLAVAYAARGDLTAADRCFDVLMHHTQHSPLEQMSIAGFLYLIGRTRWLQGRRDDARDVYAAMCAARGDFELPLAAVLRELMRGVLELADGRYAAAEQILQRAAALQQTSPFSAVFGNARAILARLYVEWNRPRDALREADSLLAEGERLRAPGLLLKEGAAIVPVLQVAVERAVHGQFASHLLALLGTAATAEPVTIPETGAMLTPRELEILRLIAEEVRNREIADRLVITVHTVKTHVAHILSKLQVASRAQAATRARELGIISAAHRR